MLKKQYKLSSLQAYLASEGLDGFDAWWSLRLDQVDRGNDDRGGWSTVCRFEHANRSFYVKRQSNYLSFNFYYPVFDKPLIPLKIPTLKAEFDKINWYRKKQIACLDVVYFGWRKLAGEHQAILVTEALNEYQSLDELLSSGKRISFVERQRLCQSVGRAIAKLHDAGIEHRNLYGKHIFVRQMHDTFDIRFIDLESSRSNLGLRSRKLRDLETLSRRTSGVNKSDKLRTLLAYLMKDRVDNETRKDIQIINRRTLYKLKR